MDLDMCDTCRDHISCRFDYATYFKGRKTSQPFEETPIC